MRIVLLLLWAVSGGAYAEDHSHAESDEENTISRRLREWARHIKVVDHPPELLDERRQTPLLEFSGLVLRHVVTINRDNARLLGHAQFSDEYHEQRRLREADSSESAIHRLARDRRLSEIQTELLVKVSQTPFSFFTPRDRVRVFTAINAAALPEEAVMNVSRSYWAAGGLVHTYPADKMAFTKKTSEISDPSLLGMGNWTPAMMEGNFSGSTETIANVYRDGLSLRGAQQAVKATASLQTPGWKEDHFYPDQRIGTCQQRKEEDPRCWEDAGIALSVYQDTLNTIVVYHSDWSMNWFEYIKWQNRAWIIDELETQLKNQWTIDSRQAVTPDMATRKGEAYDENLERCAFKDEANQPFKDVSSFSARTDIPVDKLNTEGYWQLVKTMTRLILPETRDRVAEKARTIYFTGSGFGGVWSSLSSMWLKKVDDSTYDSFNIAGGGFQCLARKLTLDMSPWDAHTQVKNYAHVMDLFARMDHVSGYTCLYGGGNMTEGSEIHTFCGAIVGFSGPQLMYRGEPVGEYLDKGTQEKVKEGRKNFDACHYYVHSPWYAAMLFVSDKILLADGTTDGGCKTVAPIEQNDQLGRCPTASRIESDCEAIADTSQDLPVMAMAAVAGGLAGLIVLLACTGYCCLQRMRNDMWVFGQDKRSAETDKGGCWQRCLAMFGAGREYKNKQKKKRAQGNRAKQARDRAKQARINKQVAAESGGKKKKKKDKANEEEEWEALKDKLGHDFDVDNIGKADDSLAAAAAVMGNRTATALFDDLEEDLAEDVTTDKKADKHHKKDKDEKGHKHKDKDKSHGKTKKEEAHLAPSSSVKPAKPRSSVRKPPRAKSADGHADDHEKKKDKKKHASSPPARE